MALGDIKNQLQERWQEVWAKVQDSPQYNSLRERFETLPSTTQKIIIFGSIGFGLFLLLSLPYTYISSSSGLNAEYEDIRQTTRSLLRASRLASDSANLPASMAASDVISRIQGDLASFNLTADQITPPTTISLSELEGSFIKPGKITQEALSVTLKKLNLKQIVDIGHRLQNINPGVKVAGMEIRASAGETGYFDTIFKLVTFTVPASESTDTSAPSRPRGRPRPVQKDEPADETEDSVDE